MKTLLVLLGWLIVFPLALASCGGATPAVNEKPSPTAVIQPTQAIMPTETPKPTATPAPTETPTPAPKQI